MKKRDFIVILPVVVFVLGMIGFLQEGSGVYEAILSSLKLLKVDLDPRPWNLFIEAGRWAGIIFFFGLIYAVLAAAVRSVLLYAKTKNMEAVAVHGDSVYAEILVKALGKNGIGSDRRISFRAPRQVILFEDDRHAMDFYQKHSSELKKAKEVHLCLDLGNHVSVESDNVYITNISEVRAIDYWTKHYSSGNEKIAIIGSGRLAKAVFCWGLLTNVAGCGCGNSYYLLGNYDKFLAVHDNTEKMIGEYGGDKVLFCRDEWYLHKDVLMDSDRIILCGDTMMNFETALDIKSAGVKCPVHVFVENSNINAFTDDSVTAVGTLSEKNIIDVLLMDSIHKAGKLCHATYMVLEKRSAEDVDAGTVESFIRTAEFTESWKKLDSFTRGSNYAAAIHDPVKMELMKNAGIDVRGLTAAENEKLYFTLNEDVRAMLQETEHIRWCRYHLLNNWKKPEKDIVINGEKRAKDSVNRLHHDLVPYTELSGREQEKDSYFYTTLSLRVNGTETGKR